MNKKYWYSIAFFLIYVVFVIVATPASWVVSMVKLPSNVAMHNVQGSIWRSHIQSVFIQGQVINNVDIELKLMSLLLLNPSADIRFGDALGAGPEGQLTASGFFSDLSITNAQIFISANDIAQLLPLPLPMSAHSQVELDVKQLTLGQPICQQANGNVSWKNAAITALDERVKLGDIQATLNCNQGELVAEITPNNILGLNFLATLGEGNQLSGDGYLQPTAQFPEQLQAVLPFIGNADSNGRYRLYF